MHIHTCHTIWGRAACLRGHRCHGRIPSERAKETSMRVVTVDWDAGQVGRLARALGPGWAVTRAGGAAAAARGLWARRPDAVVLVPGGPLDELGALLDACEARRVPLFVGPPAALGREALGHL